MSSEGEPSLEHMLEATVRIPPHVALRAFAEETVALNPTGGRFLELLEERHSFRAALELLQSEFPTADPLRIRADVHEFCVALAASGLIEIDTEDSR
jgi:hypothetical protein